MRKSSYLIENESVARAIRHQYQLPEAIEVIVRFITMRQMEDQLMYLFEVQWQHADKLHITEVWINHGRLLSVPLEAITLTH